MGDIGLANETYLKLPVISKEAALAVLHCVKQIPENFVSISIQERSGNEGH